jgi:hypothetical protein
MAEVLSWLEGSTLAAWTRESPSLWAYPTVLTLHTVGLSIVVGANAVIDLRLLGFAPRIPRQSLAFLFPVIWSAFAINAASGVLLFIADATTKSAQPVFYVKLACIGVALWMTVLARRLTGGRDPGAPASGTLIAALSLIFWSGAIVAGRLMAYL